MRRGAWLVVLVAAAVTVAATFLSLRQDERYSASADVFLGQNAASDATGLISQIFRDPERAVETQESLARLPVVWQRALRSEPQGGALSAASSVSGKPNADILTFSVTASQPQLAARLATAYARAYTDYRRKLDTAGVAKAQREIERELASLRAAGKRGTNAYDDLVQKDQQLRTTQALQGSQASLVRQAGNPLQTQPKPARNAVFAAILGLLLGLGIVFLRDALNTRIRSVEEVEERLQLPLLARVPELSARGEDGHRLAMIYEPKAVEAEVFRMAVTNIDFTNLDRGATSFIITSAHRGEGKSTTAINIAAAYARRGQHVILVDMDLRSPSLASFLGLSDQPGVTNVALGRASLEDALVRVPLVQKTVHESSNGDPETGSTSLGTLELLPSGALPPDASEFVASPSVANLLSELSERADLLLIDTPPALAVSDTLALSAKVDALVAVTRLGEVRRSELNELARLLATAPIVKLGFIATGVGADGDYGYGYGYGHGYGYGYGQSPGTGAAERGFVARRLLRRKARRRASRAAKGSRTNATRAPSSPVERAETKPAETLPVAAPPLAAPTSSTPAPLTGERTLILRSVERAKLLRALDLFNRSEHAGDIAGSADSAAAPKASVYGSDSLFTEALLTIAWDHSWHQYVIDLTDTEDAVRPWASGETPKHLPAQFQRWNATARADGSLELMDPANWAREPVEITEQPVKPG